MTEILQTNVFFFITAAAIIVFTMFLCVAVFYVINILRSVNNITKRLDASSENLTEDIKRLRHHVVTGGLWSQIVGLFVKTPRAKKRERKGDD